MNENENKNENEIKNGIVCFTFDDRNFQGWINALPLFRRYNARASFFISGEIDAEAADCMKLLKSDGHTVGLHTLAHADAPEYFEKKGSEAYINEQILPQLDRCSAAGIEISSFAYPNNRRNDATDLALSRYFKRFRAGRTGAEYDQIYLPAGRLAVSRVMRGFGIGEYYHTEQSELLAQIHKASAENLCLTFFSHNIADDAKFINMPVSLIECCLETAAADGVLSVGFDELP